MENARPGAGVRGTGSRGVENAGSGGKRGVWWKTQGLVENAGSGGNAGYHFFAKILLAYIAMNISSASRPDTGCSIKRAN